MKINKELINQFEKQLNPQNLNESSIPVKVVGFGEISAIFQLNGVEDVVYKRMPLFKTKDEAKKYAAMYREYCDLLRDVGLNLPEDELIIVEHDNNRPAVLYIVQKSFNANEFCHNLVHSLNNENAKLLINQVAKEMLKVWDFNKASAPSLELALDGQLSNWVAKSEGDGSEYKLYYIDTSTPLYRKEGVEQQDPELLLQSAPGFLRWMIRLFFLSDVMNRYYDLKEVYKDLAGNLYKEQRADLIPDTIKILNRHLQDSAGLLALKDVEKYYKEDKIIWSLFLTLRRIDCFIKTKILFSRYEFMLPGKIKR